MVYANPVLARGVERFATRGRRRRRRRPDRPRPAARRGRRAARGLRRRGPRAGAAGRRRPRPTSAWPRSGADARGFVYTVSLAGTTGERDELPPGARAHGRARARGGRACPVAVGFGISTPGQARRVGGDRRRRDRRQPRRARRRRGRGRGGRRARPASSRAGLGVGCARWPPRRQSNAKHVRTPRRSSAPTSTPSSRATPRRWPRTGPDGRRGDPPGRHLPRAGRGARLLRRAVRRDPGHRDDASTASSPTRTTLLVQWRASAAPSPAGR